MPAVASLNGMDLSGTVRPTNANDGAIWYDQTNRIHHTYDATLKIWIPGTPLHLAFTAAGAGGFFDDFRGVSIHPSWTLGKGSDDLAAYPVLAGGDRVSLVSGDSGVNFAADGSLLTSISLGTIATRTNGQPFIIPFKVKVSAITNVSYFVGITDTAGFEAPASLTTTTFTTTATDAAVILFDTAATTDTIRLVGVSNDVDATPVDTSLAPVADTYESWYLSVNSSGDVAFYREGVLLGTLLVALRTSVPIFFVAGVTSRSTASRTLSLDYSGIG